MNQFVLQALRKFTKITREQAREVFANTIEEMDRLETALDSLNLGILICDTAHKLLFTNKFAQRMLDIKGYEPGVQLVWHLLHNEPVSSFLCAMLNSGDRVEECEIETEIRSDLCRILSFNVLPLVKLYRVTGSVIIVEDVTKKREREAKIRRIESLASLTTLAAGVAHEIKNPLASISIHIQLVKKMMDQIRQKCTAIEDRDGIYKKLTSHLEVVDEEVDRLNHIVVDFLFAVRPLDLTLIRADINNLLDGILKLLAVEFQERGIYCILELSEKLPLAEFDERTMKEAILNLIKNSMEAMENGGCLTIRTKYSEADITISIIDTGKGMSEETLSKIFEPYFTTKASGTGLGLTQVFKIVREHHGEISVHSRLGEGSTFNIILPLPQTAEQRLLGYDAKADNNTGKINNENNENRI